MSAPAEHHDVTRPVFGFIADPTDYFFRAFEAMQRAERMADTSARWLADSVVRTDATTATRVDYAADEYRSRVAAQTYAAAVYDAQAEKVRAR